MIHFLFDVVVSVTNSRYASQIKMYHSYTSIAYTHAAFLATRKVTDRT